MKTSDLIFFNKLGSIKTNTKFLIKGIDNSNNKSVYFPLESVLYNSTAKKANYYGITTNGCACGLNKEFTLESSLLELIERDALMCTWHNKIIPRYIPQIYYDKFVKEKELFWQSRGAVVEVLDISMGEAVTILVILYSKGKNINFVSSGCAADRNFTLAIKKAFSEAEPNYIHIISNYEDKTSSGIIEEKNVTNVIDHMKYYFIKNNFKKLDWLLDKKTRKKEININPKFNYKILIKKYKIYTFVIKSPNKNFPFWILKSVSKNFVPIYFGKKFIPINHPKINSKSKKFNSNIHFFA